jgi:hypothetical protein
MKAIILVALLASVGCASTPAPVAPKPAWEPPVQPEQEFTLTIAPDRTVEKPAHGHPAHNLTIPQSAPTKKSTPAE